MPMLLLVDDDEAFRSLLATALRDEGHEVVEAADAEAALFQLNVTRVDAMLVDVRLPGMSGLDLMREVARRGPTPMIAVTAQDDSNDVVAGLEAGADDYVTKPFASSVLVARLGAVLRRAATPPIQPVGSSITFDPTDGSVRRNGVAVALTPIEHHLLVVLASAPGYLHTREELLQRVWHHDAFADPRVVDIHIARLRSKLEDDPANSRHLRAARGFGYRFVP